jgi:DNA-binding NtrC family response regulator
MKKIMVVDDEETISELLQVFLENQGFQVVVAGSAERALEMLKTEKPEVVMLDILMPGLNGIQCLERIKKLSPETIVIIMSGLQDEEIAKEAITLGAYDYITKPFDLDYFKQNLLKRLFSL